jgi:hypothetical protein
MQIKSLKNTQYFLDRMEKESLTQTSDLKTTQENQDTKIEKYPNWITIEKKGKKMYI